MTDPIVFPVPDCLLDPGLPPIEQVLIECLDVDDLRPSDLKAGGRVAIVTIYPDTAECCSGQYGTFQVLNGLGGQITSALYLGSSATHFGTSGLAGDGGPEVDVPAVEVPVDCGDKIVGGERALAVRDRGRWYVTKMSGSTTSTSSSSSTSTAKAMIVGGNSDPIDGKYINKTVNGVQVVSSENCEYGRYRPYLYPPDLRAINQNGLSVPAEWGEGDSDLSTLSDDYELGGLFPDTGGTRLPDGLGWASLLSYNTLPKRKYDYPYLGGRIVIDTVAAITPAEALIKLGSGESIIYVRCTQGIGTVVAGLISVTVDGSPVGVGSADVYMGCYVKVTCSTDVSDDAAAAIQVNLGEGAVVSTSAYGGTSSASVTLTAVFIDKGLYQYGIYVGDAANQARLKQTSQKTSAPRAIAITHSDEDDTKFIIWWDQPVQSAPAAPSVTGIIAAVDGVNTTIQSGTTTESKTTLTVTPALDAGASFLVFIPAGLVRGTDGTEANAQASQWCYFAATASSMVPVAYGLSGVLAPVLKYGDLISIPTNGVEQLSEYEGDKTSRPFYRFDLDQIDHQLQPGQIFGGNVPDIYGGTSGVAEAIVFAPGEPYVEDWEDYSLPETPNIALFGVGTQPPDGLGLTILSPIGIGELETEHARDRYVWSQNNTLGRAAVRGDVVGLLRPKLLTDQQEPYNIRVVWSMM